MTQILVTLENGADSNLIQKIIDNIKGVFKTSHIEPVSPYSQSGNAQSEWLSQIEKLSGSFDPNLIDLNDERTKYIMSK